MNLSYPIKASAFTHAWDSHIQHNEVNEINSQIPSGKNKTCNIPAGIQATTITQFHILFSWQARSKI